MGCRILRALRWVIASLCLTVVGLSLAIHADQCLLRRRAERLQSDIRSIELRKSTYEDARTIIDRWRNTARQQGRCRPDWCDVEFTLGDFAWGYADFDVNTQTRRRIFNWLGARPARVEARIRVRNNLVVGKRIGGYIEGSCNDSDGEMFCTMIGGGAGTGGRHAIDVRHPEYTFYEPSGCDGPCVDADVIFSAYASAEDVRRLTDVNFGCITRWTPCENEKDILPTAWRQVESEGAPPPHVASCSESIRALTRDLGCVPLATVAHVTDVGDGPQLTVRWENDCRKGKIERRDIFPQPVGSPRIRAGDRLLVFEEELFGYQTCAVVPATEENLRAAQQGVAEDLSDHSDPIRLPVGAIKPPEIP
jgi:hypothetical protein